MNSNRFYNLNLTFGSEDISTLFAAICACIAESELLKTKEEEVVVA